jgi:arylsulfatase A
MVCTIDLATSLAKLTGTAIPKNAFKDSFDVSDALLGKPDAKGTEQVSSSKTMEVGGNLAFVKTNGNSPDIQVNQPAIR